MAPLALVVENDSGARKLLDVLLTRFNCEVDAVANGADALLLLERIEYDLALIDLFVPGASGTEIVEWMRANRPEAVERAVLLSSAPPSILDRMRVSHAPLRVIRKPFELYEIIDLINEVRQRPEHAPMPLADRFSRRSITAGARAGVLVRTSGASLELVYNFGYRAQDVESWFPMLASDPYPLCVSVRERRAQWFASLPLAAEEYPRLEHLWRQTDSRALASVPVIRDGMVVGAAGWSFRDPQPFDENEQRAFTAIAEETVAAFDAFQSGAAANA